MARGGVQLQGGLAAQAAGRRGLAACLTALHIDSPVGSGILHPCSQSSLDFSSLLRVLTSSPLWLLARPVQVGNYWINIATLTGSNSPAVLHYEGAPMPDADPKLGAPKLDLGCKYQLDQAGIIDFKDQTLRPYRGLPKPPAKATVAHVVYLSDSGVPSLSKEMVLGNRSIYNLDPQVRLISRSLPLVCCWLCFGLLLQHAAVACCTVLQPAAAHLRLSCLLPC